MNILLPMHCLIVDDNIIARTTMKKLVSQDPGLILAGECADAMEAYRHITTGKVDLLFLDIEMEDMSGIELVKSLGSKNPIIIFTTSKKDYAAEAFELNVADYITKPVTPVRFLQAVEKAWEIYKSKKQEVKTSPDEFIFIRDSNTVRRLKLDEILFAEAMGDYVKLFTSEKFYAIHSSLKDVESKLPANKFLRVHRSFVVQIGKIDTMEGGTLIINKKLIPVADTYRAALSQRLKIL